MKKNITEKNERPLVSIGIPVHNGGVKLRNSLSSIFNQSYYPVEIIISDNASTDGTADYLNKLNAPNNINVKIYSQTTNIGPTENFKFVLQKSSGKYFMWLAHDDVISPAFIAECVDALEANTDLVLVSGMSKIDDIPTNHPQTHINFLQDEPLSRMNTYLQTVTDNSIFYGLIRKSSLNKIKLKNCLAGDWLVVCGLLVQGKAQTLTTVNINRGSGGTSKTIKNIVNILRLPKFSAKLPFISIATNLASEILTPNYIYSSLKFTDRVLLLLRMLFTIIVVKPRLPERARHRLNMLRNKLSNCFSLGRNKNVQ